MRAPFTFDETGFERQGERDGLQLWYTPDGDALGLYHFRIRPDIGAAIDASQWQCFAEFLHAGKV